MLAVVVRAVEADAEVDVACCVLAVDELDVLSLEVLVEVAVDDTVVETGTVEVLAT